MEKKDIIQHFPKVFAETTGQLAGEYHIQLASGCKPVQHVPRRVPVAIREKVRQKLNDLEAQGILTKVTQPTAWISSMVEVIKPNGQLKIYLDLRDLN